MAAVAFPFAAASEALVVVASTTSNAFAAASQPGASTGQSVRDVITSDERMVVHVNAGRAAHRSRVAPVLSGEKTKE